MKNVMNIIGLVIDFVTMIIQVPYIFIAGFIMGWTYCPGFASKTMYIWYPTYGAIEVWMRPYGDITYDVITYKELFH